jgi:hypothetical protein
LLDKAIDHIQLRFVHLRQGPDQGSGISCSPVMRFVQGCLRFVISVDEHLTYAVSEPGVIDIELAADGTDNGPDG